MKRNALISKTFWSVTEMLALPSPRSKVQKTNSVVSNLSRVKGKVKVQVARDRDKVRMFKTITTWHVPAIVQELPAFSQPLFIRILREVEATGTFKQNKVPVHPVDRNMERGCLLITDRSFLMFLGG